MITVAWSNKRWCLSHWQNKKGNKKLKRAVSQLAGQTMVGGRKTGWFIVVNSKTMHVTFRITMGANYLANQCHFSIFAPPAGSIQKHAPVTRPRQWIVHFMNIDSPGWCLEGRALWEQVLMMGGVWVMVWWLNVKDWLKYIKRWRRPGLGSPTENWLLWWICWLGPLGLAALRGNNGPLLFGGHRGQGTKVPWYLFLVWSVGLLVRPHTMWYVVNRLSWNTFPPTQIDLL